MLFHAPITRVLPTFEQVMKRTTFTELAAPSTSEMQLTFTARENGFTRRVTLRHATGNVLSSVDVFVDGKRCLRGVADGRVLRISAPQLGLTTAIPFDMTDHVSISGIRFQRSGKRVSADLSTQLPINDPFASTKWKTLRQTQDFYNGRPAQRVDFLGRDGKGAEAYETKVSAWLTDAGRSVPYIMLTAPAIEMTGTFRSHRGAEAATFSGFDQLRAVPLSVFKAKCADLFSKPSK